MRDRGWTHFEHGADIGVRGFGPTIEAAFEQAARALTAVVVDPDEVSPTSSVDIACAAPDDEILLVDWLNAVIFEMAARGMVFGGFEVHIEEARLTANARGEPLDRSRHAPAVEVKGATFTELRVAQRQGNWIAQCVVDV
jgi:tRNA nucleotidyltransferase (CCA-adding enzyme)